MSPYIFKSILTDRVNFTFFAYGETGSGKTYSMQYLAEKILKDFVKKKELKD